MFSLLPIELLNTPSEHIIPYPLDCLSIYGIRYWQVEKTVETEKQARLTFGGKNLSFNSILSTSFIESLEGKLTPELGKTIVKFFKEGVAYTEYRYLYSRWNSASFTIDANFNGTSKIQSILETDQEPVIYSNKRSNLYIMTTSSDLDIVTSLADCTSIISKRENMVICERFMSENQIVIGISDEDDRSRFKDLAIEAKKPFKFPLLSKYIVYSPIGYILNIWSLTKDGYRILNTGEKSDKNFYFDIKTQRELTKDEFDLIKKKREQNFKRKQNIKVMPNISFFYEKIGQQNPYLIKNSFLKSEYKDGSLGFEITNEQDNESINKVLLNDVSEKAALRSLNDLNFDFSVVSDEEKAILSRLIDTHILGRSGSGKTTCLLGRIWLDQCKGYVYRTKTKQKLYPRSLFITVSPILANEVKTKFYSSSLGKLIIEEEKSEGFGDFDYNYDCGSDYIACYFRDHFNLPSFISLTLNALIALIDISSNFPYLPEYSEVDVYEPDGIKKKVIRSGFLENCDITVRSIPNDMKGNLNDVISNAVISSPFKYKGKRATIQMEKLHRMKNITGSDNTNFKNKDYSLYKLKMSILEKGRDNPLKTSDCDLTPLYYLDYQTFHNEYFNQLLKSAREKPIQKVPKLIPLSVRGFIEYRNGLENSYLSDKSFVVEKDMLETLDLIENYMSSDVIFSRFMNYDCSSLFPIDNPLTPKVEEGLKYLYKHYLVMKIHNKLFDLTDIIDYEINNLHNGDALKLFDRIYVDECQDIPIKAIYLIKGVLKADSSIGCIVAGDTAQNISRALSTKLANVFDLFRSHNFPAIDDKPFIALTKNYRCTQPVLDLASSIVDIISRRFPSSIDILPTERSVYNEEKAQCDKSTFLKPLVIWGRDSIKTSIELFSKFVFRKLLNHSGKDGEDISSSTTPDFGAHQCILVPGGTAKENIPSTLRSVILSLSIMEAKGLEFDDTFLIGCITNTMGAPPYLVNKYWRLLFNMLEESDAKRNKNPGKDKNYAGLSERTIFDGIDSDNLTSCMSNWIMLLLKKIYVSLTRSRHSLVLIDGYDDKSYDIGASKKSSYMFNRKVTGGWINNIHPLYKYWVEKGLVDLIIVDKDSILTEDQETLLLNVFSHEGSINKDQSSGENDRDKNVSGWLVLIQSLLLQSKLEAAENCVEFAKKAITKEDIKALEVLCALEKQLSAYKIIESARDVVDASKVEALYSKAGSILLDLDSESSKFSHSGINLKETDNDYDKDDHKNPYSQYYPSGYKSFLVRCLVLSKRFEEAGDIEIKIKNFSAASRYYIIAKSVEKLRECLNIWREAMKSDVGNINIEESKEKDGIVLSNSYVKQEMSRFEMLYHIIKILGNIKASEEIEMSIDKFCCALIENLFGVQDVSKLEDDIYSLNFIEKLLRNAILKWGEDRNVGICMFGLRRAFLLLISTITVVCQKNPEFIPKDPLVKLLEYICKEDYLDILNNNTMDKKSNNSNATNMIKDSAEYESELRMSKPINILSLQLVENNFCRLKNINNNLKQSEINLIEIKNHIESLANMSLCSCLSEFILSGSDSSYPENFVLLTVSKHLSTIYSNEDVDSQKNEKIIFTIDKYLESVHTILLYYIKTTSSVYDISTDGENFESEEKNIGLRKVKSLLRDRATNIGDIISIAKESKSKEVIESLNNVFDILISDSKQKWFYGTSEVEEIVKSGDINRNAKNFITGMFRISSKMAETENFDVYSNNYSPFNKIFLNELKYLIVYSNQPLSKRLEIFSLFLKAFYTSPKLLDQMLDDTDAISALVATLYLEKEKWTLEDKLEATPILKDIIKLLFSIANRENYVKQASALIIFIVAMSFENFFHEIQKSYKKLNIYEAIIKMYFESFLGDKGNVSDVISKLINEYYIPNSKKDYSVLFSKYNDNISTKPKVFKMFTSLDIKGVDKGDIGRIVYHVSESEKCLDCILLHTFVSRIPGMENAAMYLRAKVERSCNIILKSFENKFLLQLDSSDITPSPFSLEVVKEVLSKFTEQEEFLLPPIHTITLLKFVDLSSTKNALIGVLNSLGLLNVNKGQYFESAKEKEVENYIKTINNMVKKIHKRERKLEKKLNAGLH